MEYSVLLNLLKENEIEYSVDYQIGYYNENASRFFSPDIYLPELNSAIFIFNQSRTTKRKDFIELCNRINSCTVIGIKVFVYEDHNLRKNPRRVLSEIQRKTFLQEICS